MAAKFFFLTTGKFYTSVGRLVLAKRNPLFAVDARRQPIINNVFHVWLLSF